MRILYINPNATVAMTEGIVAAARQTLPEAEISGWTNHDGPPAIQGPEDGARAVPGLMALLPKARAAGADAIVIACFDDTGLEEIRSAAHCPVLGIGQSAYVMAGLLGRRFSVVTTLAVSVPVIAGNISRQGFAGQCVSVRPSGLPVLRVEAGGEEVRAILQEEFRAAQAEGAETVVLGCAGMAPHLEELASGAALPLIDGVRASAHLAWAAARSAGRKVA